MPIRIFEKERKKKKSDKDDTRVGPGRGGCCVAPIFEICAAQPVGQEEGEGEEGGGGGARGSNVRARRVCSKGRAMRFLFINPSAWGGCVARGDEEHKS